MTVPPSPSSSEPTGSGATAAAGTAGAASASAEAVPAARRHLAPTGIGETGRHLPVRAIARDAVDETARQRRDLEIAVGAVVGMSAVLGGAAIWLVAILLAAATALGTFRLLSAVEGVAHDAGVPIESLIVPALTAFGAATAVHLLPLGAALIPAVIAAGFLLDRVLAVETSIVRAPQAPSEGDRTASLVTMLVVALVAFAGVAAIVPGGLAGLEPAGAPAPPLPVDSLAVLALADAAIAGLLGYRAAALRTADAKAALLSAAGYAVVVAIGAAAVRALGIPRLVGPAVLMFLFYLWDTLHSAPPSRRRDPRWLWETAILVGLGLVVVAWNLRVES
jgi:hypothetical protein